MIGQARVPRTLLSAAGWRYSLLYGQPGHGLADEGEMCTPARWRSHLMARRFAGKPWGTKHRGIVRTFQRVLEGGDKKRRDVAGEKASTWMM